MKISGELLETLFHGISVHPKDWFKDWFINCGSNTSIQALSHYTGPFTNGEFRKLLLMGNDSEAVAV